MQKNKNSIWLKKTKNSIILKQEALASTINTANRGLSLKSAYLLLPKIEKFINQKLYEKAVINAELQLAESYKKIIFTKQRVKNHKVDS